VRFLLDTSALLFWLEGSPRIKKPLRDRLAEPANLVFVSAVSAFEIAVKASLGKLRLSGDPAAVLPPFFERSGLSTLPITVKHGLGVYALPRHHDDPFDRLLISQAIAEDLTLVSSDGVFSKYAVKLVVVE
jgi:PIN domain nuclease of toxin-antitoxin system